MEVSPGSTSCLLRMRLMSSNLALIQSYSNHRLCKAAITSCYSTWHRQTINWGRTKIRKQQKQVTIRRSRNLWSIIQRLTSKFEVASWPATIREFLWLRSLLRPLCQSILRRAKKQSRTMYLRFLTTNTTYWKIKRGKICLSLKQRWGQHSRQHLFMTTPQARTGLSH